MPAEQTRNPLQFPETTSLVTWGHFGDRYPPILHTRCSISGDALLRVYG